MREVITNLILRDGFATISSLQHEAGIQFGTAKIKLLEMETETDVIESKQSFIRGNSKFKIWILKKKEKKNE